MNPNIDLTNNSQGESITVSGFNISKNASNAYLRKPTSHSTPNEPVHDKSNTHGTRPGVSTSPPTHTPTQNFFIPWTPKLGPEERHRLWNESRFDSNGNEISKDEGREFNRKNIVSSLKLAPYVFAQLFRIQWEACGFRILLTYLSTTIHGILPAWRAVAMANLMDAVQEALSSRQSSDVKRIVWLAAIDIVAANTETLLNLLFRNNEELVSSLITEKFQRMYLESTLLMDIPTINDPQIRPVLFEAGVFAGIEHQFTYRGRSSDHFSSLLSVFTSLLHVLSQAAILLKVLTSASNPLSWANLLFAFITFLPAFITLIERFVIVAPVYLGDFGMKTRQITQLGQMGPYKQEILLFGLADWVLQKWENVTFDSRQRRTEYRQNERISYTGVNIIRDSLHSMQYAFIAIGAFPATISLGSMRLCQNSASSLVSTLMMVQDRVRLFMDMVFQFEAFSQVMQMKDVKTSEKGVLRRYETTVVDGQKRGMRIEARNLSFTYPGQTEPALKNVNLTIEPGETLAIVGFNGGGKTTLVKVLMGLYNYSGSLTINDHEASTYDRPSLHAKTTVCFQDFSRYDDTVKENVGTGNFRRMDDLELLGTALKRGGADTVVDQLDDGIDQLLHQWGTPLDAEPGAGPNKKSGKTDKVKPPKTMGKGRGRFMRMHALARDVGTNLSGGQWQRLALARAFMRSDEADLVVFDEPSSSLDAVAEHELFERIHGLSKSETGQKIKTTIYVSHRFNTTRKADKIAVVENGTVTEVGSHDKLMALGGRYAEFFNLQAQAFL